MRTVKLFTIATALVATLAACEKAVVSTPPHSEAVPGSEIAFSASGLDIDVNTRASVVSNLDGGFYAIAATGAAGSQNNYWGEVVSVTKSGSSYLTGKYWPASDPGLTSFYASNVSPTFAASGPTVTLADCNTDVVCAHAASPTYGSPCALTFEHILARIGTITINAQPGYDIIGASFNLQDMKNGGVYNLRTKEWSDKTAYGGSSPVNYALSTSGVSNDLWLIPGTYSVQVWYTLRKGDYSKFITKNASITLSPGLISNISATATGGDAQEIVFTISVTPWSSNAIAMEWDSAINSHPFSVSAVKTVQFAKSNLQYQASSGSWRLAQYPWSYVGNAAGNTTATASRPTDTNWIDLFGWGASGYNSTYPYLNTENNADYAYPGAATDIAGTNYDWGQYCAISSYNGAESFSAGELRTLTKSEWEYLYSHAPGYACVNGINGMILFSDDYADPAACPTKAACAAAMQNVTSAQWALMDAAGAVFLPAAGCRSGSSVHDAGSFGYYWSSTAYDADYDAYCLTFNEGEALAAFNYSRYCGLSVRLVKD